ncbi:hypothetical protein HFO56_33185 [Rhizobium laguerreae]|uniref:hypothetical protein n=1 Tax=Rhizobium laguerreae TaxID=1076926 RepID=UPI001C91C074|nr:hypothetical protein [Rhizobium laguerreae]MBY3157180.1 hypothetical protein [Rhizobium laguerreae]
MLALVGIDPAKAPTRQQHVAAKQMSLLVRYIGYKAGLQAAKQSRCDHDLEKDDTAILGDFIATRLTFRATDYPDRSLFHEMRRMLALVEGATGYPMTSDRTERKALVHFLKAVLDDIRQLKAKYDATGGQAPIEESETPARLPAPSI